MSSNVETSREITCRLHRVFLPPRRQSCSLGMMSRSNRAMRSSVFLEVTLMIFLRAPELRRGLDLRHDRSLKFATLLKLLFRRLRDRFLFGRMIKNDRATLRPD